MMSKPFRRFFVGLYVFTFILLRAVALLAITALHLTRPTNQVSEGKFVTTVKRGSPNLVYLRAFPNLSRLPPGLNVSTDQT